MEESSFKVQPMTISEMPVNHGGGEPLLWDPLGAWPKGRCWLWAVLAVLACFLQGLSFIQNLRPLHPGVDFFQEWASARNLYSGLAVYTDQEITSEKYLNIKIHRDDKLYIKRNAHPPTSVLLALPLAALSYSDATLAWNLASLAAFAVSLWLVLRGLGITPAWWAVFPTVALVLTCSPLRQQMNQGQLNMVLLLLITGVWAADRSGRPGLAGALLGAATAIKLFPGFLFLYFLLRRRWTVVLAGVVSLAALTAATAAILGVEAYRDYVRFVLPEVSRFRYSWANVSLVGFWGKVLGEGTWLYDSHILPVARLPRVALAGTLLSCAGVLFLWARVVWQAGTQAEAERGFGLALIAMPLLSPVAWDHYLLISMLALFQLWIALPKSNLGKCLRLGLLACLWADLGTLYQILLPESFFRAGEISAPWTLVTLLSYQCYTLLALFGLGLVCLGAMIRCRRVEPEGRRLGSAPAVDTLATAGA
jgi:hypothetical protein